MFWVGAQQELPRKACKRGSSEGKQQRQGDSTRWTSAPSHQMLTECGAVSQLCSLFLSAPRAYLFETPGPTGHSRPHASGLLDSILRQPRPPSARPPSPCLNPVLDLDYPQPDPTNSKSDSQFFEVPCSTPPCLSSEKPTPSSSLTQTRSASKQRAVMVTSALPRSPWPLPQPRLHLRPLRPSRPRPRVEIASPSVR